MSKFTEAYNRLWLGQGAQEDLDTFIEEWMRELLAGKDTLVRFQRAVRRMRPLTPHLTWPTSDPETR